jgi:MFS family permease
VSEAPSSPSPSVLGGINRNVIALGVVSLLTDVSSEMIVPVMPLFITGILGASLANLGLIEGVAESTASVLRIGSGWLSDRIGRRKPFLMFGYGLSAVAKAALAWAGSWAAVLALRFSDRVGKGLRNPPRDALIADSVDRSALGRAFGFHRALDTLGAAIGPLVAFLLLGAFPGQYRRIFIASAIPAALSILTLALFVRAPRATVAARPRAMGLAFRGFRPAFYRFLLVAGVFSLANSSTAFLLLLANGAGRFTAPQVTLIYFGYNLLYALLSWPIGILSDRIGRRPMLLGAYLLFAALYAMLAWRAGPATVIAGFALLGLHSALLEGSQRSLVGDLVPDAMRGTGFGLYYTVVGAALLPASWVAGVLWDRFGARAMLATDAALAAVAALLFALLLSPRDEWKDRDAAAA